MVRKHGNNIDVWETYIVHDGEYWVKMAEAKESLVELECEIEKYEKLFDAETRDMLIVICEDNKNKDLS